MLVSPRTREPTRIRTLLFQRACARNPRRHGPLQRLSRQTIKHLWIWLAIPSRAEVGLTCSGPSNNGLELTTSAPVRNRGLRSSIQC
jgi:hypothetical protein